MRSMVEGVILPRCACGLPPPPLRGPPPRTGEDFRCLTLQDFIMKPMAPQTRHR